jgi:hypothetical protein
MDKKKKKKKKKTKGFTTRQKQSRFLQGVRIQGQESKRQSTHQTSKADEKKTNRHIHPHRDRKRLVTAFIEILVAQTFQRVIAFCQFICAIHPSHSGHHTVCVGGVRGACRRKCNREKKKKKKKKKRQRRLH